MKKLLVIFTMVLFVGMAFAQEPKVCQPACTQHMKCQKHAQAEQNACCKGEQKNCDKKQCCKCAKCDKKDTCTKQCDKKACCKGEQKNCDKKQCCKCAKCDKKDTCTKQCDKKACCKGEQKTCCKKQ